MTVIFNKRGERGEILLYSQVGENFWGDGVTAESFKKNLASLGGVSDIDLRINSEGGEVFDGFAIYNALAQHQAKVTVHIDGLAASIASVIAMAGDTIHIAKNAMIMIHNPQSVAVGDSREMARKAALMDQVKGNLVQTYESRTGSKAADIETWMDDETWFTADQAVERGFADKVVEGQQISACFDLSRFRNLPASLKARMQNAVPTPSLDVRRARIADIQRRAA